MIEIPYPENMLFFQSMASQVSGMPMLLNARSSIYYFYAYMYKKPSNEYSILLLLPFNLIYEDLLKHVTFEQGISVVP